MRSFKDDTTINLSYLEQWLSDSMNTHCDQTLRLACLTALQRLAVISVFFLPRFLPLSLPHGLHQAY